MINNGQWTQSFSLCLLLTAVINPGSVPLAATTLVLAAPPQEVPGMCTARDIITPKLGGGQERKYEVHFPQNFVQYHPWGWGDVPYQLRVSRLCHVTHEEQAKQIRPNDHHPGHYHFQVHRKYGKSDINSDHYGESYRCMPETLNEDVPGVDTLCYQPVYHDEPVLPGYYSWWGLAVDLQARVQQPSIESKYLPPYLKTPPESVYGNFAFNSSFFDLLQSYKSSRGRGLGDIYLKMGGTLRYKREIAYVVIVCTSHDLGALDSYYPITCAPIDMFDPRCLVDKNGKVVDLTRVPYFTTHYMNTYVSYETLNFAFYFNKGEKFSCLYTTIEESQIKHEFCIRSKPMVTWFDRKNMKFITKQVCNYMQENQQKRDEAIRFAEQCGVELVPH